MFTNTNTTPDRFPTPTSCLLHTKIPPLCPTTCLWENQQPHSQRRLSHPVLLSDRLNADCRPDSSRPSFRGFPADFGHLYKVVLRLPPPDPSVITTRVDKLLVWASDVECLGTMSSPAVPPWDHRTLHGLQARSRPQTSVENQLRSKRSGGGTTKHHPSL
jgi:hypothetical protein